MPVFTRFNFLGVLYGHRRGRSRKPATACAEQSSYVGGYCAAKCTLAMKPFAWRVPQDLLSQSTGRVLMRDDHVSCVLSNEIRRDRHYSCTLTALIGRQTLYTYVKCTMLPGHCIASLGMLRTCGSTNLWVDIYDHSRMPVNFCW